MTDAKKVCAKKACEYLKDDLILGIGTGKTVQSFIAELAPWRNRLQAVVASSIVTAEQLKSLNFTITELNNVHGLDLYIDSADEINEHKQMIKGGGGALTREKILATASKTFICMAEKNKMVDLLGKKAPIPIEVLPMARSFVAREIVKLGGQPEYRVGFKTDNGNVILDCYYLDCSNPLALEKTLNNIPGVVANGIFAQRSADIWLHE